MNQDDVVLSNQFQGAPAGISPFQISSVADDLMADIEAGLAVTNTNGVDNKLNYKGRIGEETSIHGGGLNIAVRY